MSEATICARCSGTSETCKCVGPGGESGPFHLRDLWPLARHRPLHSRDLWEIDEVQFPRLLAEIKAVGLTPDQVNCLRASMDLSKEEIHELLDRAEDAFETMKEKHL
jgi:hypothetical protein